MPKSSSRIAATSLPVRALPFLFALALQVGVAAAQCVDYGDYVHEVFNLRSQNVKEVEVVGNLAYVADSDLTIYDVSDPLAPVQVSHLSTPVLTQRVAYYYGFVFMSDLHSGIQVALTAPPNAFYLGNVATGGKAQELAIHGTHLYVADYPQGLTILDITDPVVPAIVGTYPVPPFGCKNVAAADGYAYVGGGTTELLVMDLAEPVAPSHVASIWLPSPARDVLIQGSTALIATWDGLHIYDVADPVHPVFLGSAAAAEPIDRLAVNGDVVLGVDVYHDLLVFDVADPTQPVLRSAIGGYPANSVTFAGDHALLSCEDRGLSVFDLGNLERLPVLNFVAGGLGWFVEGLRLGDDLFDPVSPAPLAPYDVRSRIAHTAVSGSTYYVGAYDGLHVYDTSNPSVPVPLAWLNEFGRIYALGHADDRIYLCSEAQDFQVLDAADPASISVIGSLSLGYTPSNLFVVGDTVYAIYGKRLFAIDVTVPGAPVVRGGLNLVSYGIRMLQERGGYVFAANSTFGLAVVDFSDKDAPVLVAEVGSADTCDYIRLVGDHLYASGSGGLFVFDVADPTAPFLVGGFEASGSPKSIAVAGPYVYSLVRDGIVVAPALCPYDETLDCNGNTVLDATEIAGHPSLDWNGDGILDVCQFGQGVSAVPEQGASSFVLHAAYPNPFNPQTVLAFDLLRPSRVSLRVFDVAGREVRTLLDETYLAAGMHELVWNGRDGAGRPVPSGTYHYRIETESGVATRRMTLLK